MRYFIFVMVILLCLGKCSFNIDKNAEMLSGSYSIHIDSEQVKNNFHENFDNIVKTLKETTM